VVVTGIGTAVVVGTDSDELESAGVESSAGAAVVCTVV
jgi:hypothetical protein